jgi:hypothetical protein
MAKGQLPPWLANKQNDSKKKDKHNKLKDAIERRLKARGGNDKGRNDKNPNDMKKANY